MLVLAGAAASVVLALLFNLMSDLTGGVRVTVLEEDPPARAEAGSGSPSPRPRDELRLPSAVHAAPRGYSSVG